jgi:hypothetical protein
MVFPTLNSQLSFLTILLQRLTAMAKTVAFWASAYREEVELRAMFVDRAFVSLQILWLQDMLWHLKKLETQCSISAET